jgi:hypothetical protein
VISGTLRITTLLTPKLPWSDFMQADIQYPCGARRARLVK